MKMIRLVGSLAVVLGAVTVLFAGIPWIVYHEPMAPLWLKIAIFAVLGGILLVLLSVAIEQQKSRARGEELPPDQPLPGLFLQNSDFVPGRQITQSLGLVQGHTIFAIWIGRDLSALVRLILGGELFEYTDMMGRARKVATSRMVAQAEELGADAVINVRFMTTSVIGSAAELLAYGTAVKLSNPAT